MPRTPDQISDAELRLLLAPGIGPHTHKKLLDTFGSADAVIGTSTQQLIAIPGVGRDTAQAIQRAIENASPASERMLLGKHNVSVIVRGDEDYPELLATIPDPPSALWVRGTLHQRDRLAVAIVGSRRCTAYGREQAGRFATLLAQSGLTIVSGGAKGVDAEAHRGALRVHGRTIVVLGCGLARIYPREHATLFNRIVEEEGAVLSEFPMHVEPKAENFPRRNRIVSGLSLGVLVIEAAKRSGALITARLAAEEHNREVMAVPGRVDSPASAGCLELIRGGAAALVRDHTDVLLQLDGAGELVRGALDAVGSSGAEKSGSTLFDSNLTSDQQAIVSALSEAEEDSLLLDQLAARTQLPMSRMMAEISVLQIRGRVSRNHRGVRLIQRDQVTHTATADRES